MHTQVPGYLLLAENGREISGSVITISPEVQVITWSYLEGEIVTSDFRQKISHHPKTTVDSYTCTSKSWVHGSSITIRCTQLPGFPYPGMHMWSAYQETRKVNRGPKEKRGQVYLGQSPRCHNFSGDRGSRLRRGNHRLSRNGAPAGSIRPYAHTRVPRIVSCMAYKLYLSSSCKD